MISPITEESLGIFNYLREKLGNTGESISRAQRILYLCCIINPELLESFPYFVAYPSGVIEENILLERERLPETAPIYSGSIDKALETLDPRILEMSLEELKDLHMSLYVWPKTFDYGYRSPRKYVSELFRRDSSVVTKEQKALNKFLEK